MTDWKVGDDVVIVSQGPARTREGVVVKVGRINMTVRSLPGSGESVYRMSDGVENTPEARKWSQTARRVFTPEGYLQDQERSRLEARVQRFRRPSPGRDQRLDRVSTPDLARLVELLDEIAPE